MTESLASGNIIATAKRHGIQAQQIYRWRERLEAWPNPAALLAVAVASDPGPPSPAAVPAPLLDRASRDRDPASRPDRSLRVEIVLSAGRWIIVQGGVEIDAVLALARGAGGAEMIPVPLGVKVWLWIRLRSLTPLKNYARRCRR